MEIVWTDKAKEKLKENLEFWDIHNGTPSFSDKILLEVQKLMFELSNNPIFLGRYNKDLLLNVDIWCISNSKKKMTESL